MKSRDDWTARLIHRKSSFSVCFPTELFGAFRVNLFFGWRDIMSKSSPDIAKAGDAFVEAQNMPRGPKRNEALLKA